MGPWAPTNALDRSNRCHRPSKLFNQSHSFRSASSVFVKEESRGLSQPPRRLVVEESTLLLLSLLQVGALEPNHKRQCGSTTVTRVASRAQPALVRPMNALGRDSVAARWCQVKGRRQERAHNLYSLSDAQAGCQRQQFSGTKCRYLLLQVNYMNYINYYCIYVLLHVIIYT